MNQTVDTAEWRALEASHKAAHAEAKQVPLTLLNERKSAIAQAFGEMAIKEVPMEVSDGKAIMG